MSVHKCQAGYIYPPCCKQAFDFVVDSHALVAEDCDKFKSQFGQSVALSADGRILVVGAPVLAVEGVANYGAAYVYERQRSLGAAVKTPEYKLLQRLDADSGNAGLMGYRVAISGNGQRIAVSAINRVYPGMHDGPTSGTIFIFDLACTTGKSNYVMVQRVFAQTFGDHDEIIFDNPGPNSGNFGEAMALSFDGRVLVATISNVNAPFGKVYIYEDTTCSVLKTGCCVKKEAQVPFVFRQNMDKAKLVSDSGITAILGMADSVTLDHHGDTIAIGCKEATSSQGAVLIYKRLNSDDVTWLWNQNLASPTPANGGRFGISVDMTADGTRLAVEDNDNAVNPPRGYGVVFYRPDATSQYNLEAVLPGAAPDFNFLNAFDVQIAISDNGCIVAIGYEGTKCLLQNNCGDVVTYERKCNEEGDVSTWAERQRLFEPTLRPEHRFGFAVALDGKGLTMAVGSPGPLPTGQIGKVYTYQAPTTTC